MMYYLFSYRTRHNTFDDVWARDAAHAQELLMARPNRPTSFYTLYRVTNVPPREAK